MSSQRNGCPWAHYARVSSERLGRVGLAARRAGGAVEGALRYAPFAKLPSAPQRQQGGCQQWPPILAMDSAQRALRTRLYNLPCDPVFFSKYVGRGHARR